MDGTRHGVGVLKQEYLGQKHRRSQCLLTGSKEISLSSKTRVNAYQNTRSFEIGITSHINH